MSGDLGVRLARLDRIAAVGAARYRLDGLADDVGRLRRHLASLIDGFEGTYTEGLVNRIAWHVEVLDSNARLTAAERVAAGTSVEAALDQVEREQARLRRRTGIEAWRAV